MIKVKKHAVVRRFRKFKTLTTPIQPVFWKKIEKTVRLGRKVKHMEVINSEWFMKGCAPDDPKRVHTIDEAADLIRKVGFLPLFSNNIPGFSLEEHVTPDSWWTDDPEHDPWSWRQILAKYKDIAYGKFFEKKAGFISKKWFPIFANYRRNGYDFDALFDDELASRRAKKLMDEFEGGREWLSFEVKEKAGFGKGGEKNFEGTLSDLQMQTYLIASDFRQKVNKKGEPYGWHIAALTMPENKFGYKFVTGKYSEKPSESWERIVKQIRKHFPGANEKEIRKIIGIKYPGGSR